MAPSPRGLTAPAPVPPRPTGDDGIAAPSGQVLRQRHQPGLDGLRGLALAGVVLYHCGFSFAAGGYLAVSTFFTLSGFLIGGILLRGLQRADGLGLGRFWTRRARRLLAGSFLTLLAVSTLFAWLVATPLQRSRMTGDVTASALGVANLWFIGQEVEYGAAFADPSPVMHFWSLAVEQQLYLVVPLMLVVIWHLTRRTPVHRRSAVAAALVAVAVLCTVVSIALPVDDEWRYLSTISRAPELLLGVAAAAAVVGPLGRRRPGPVLRGCALVALGVQMVMWGTVDQESTWLYRGGLLAYATLSVVVIVVASSSSAVLGRILSTRCLRVLGERSYGIYLWHWPLLLAAAELWPEGSIWARTTVALACTAVLAELSFRLVETPVRAGRWPAPGRGVPAALAGLVAVVVTAAVVGRTAPERIDFAAESEAFADATDRSRGTTGSPTTPRVLVVGDSTALLMGMGLGFWAQDAEQVVAVGGDAELGCPLARFDRLSGDPPVELSPECTDWEATWPSLVATSEADIVVVSTGTFDVADARLPDGTVGSVGDPEVDRFLVTEQLRAVDVLSSSGAVVVLLLWPPAGEWAAPTDPGEQARLDPERLRQFHALQRMVAAARPDQVRLLDLEAFLGGRASDRTLRPDGIHVPTEQAYELFRDGLGAALLQAASSEPEPNPPR